MGRQKGIDREVWWQNQRGYVEGRIFRNGVCKQVKQARWLMEQYIGRPLSPQEVVHHINGVKNDNRIENLKIIKYGEHTTIHCKGKCKKSGYKMNLTDEERQRRSDFMQEVHRRRQENDPTNKWYARTQVQRGNI